MSKKENKLNKNKKYNIPKLSAFIIFSLCLTTLSCGVKNETVKYKVIFKSTWSSKTHPTNYPNDAHFSKLVGAVHNSNITLWKENKQASTGIEQIAETGKIKKIKKEVLAQPKNANLIVVGKIPTSPGKTYTTFTASSKKSYVTLISMLAPSHDWFVGVSSLSLLDKNKKFKSSIKVDLMLYDAGTENGNDFNVNGSDTSPHQPISRVVTDASETNFGNTGNPPGTPIVGTLKFIKQ